MSNRPVTLFLLALLYLGKAQGKFLDPDVYDEDCIGMEPTGMEPTGASSVDQLIRQYQRSPNSKRLVRFIRRQVRDPGSGFGSMMGSAAMNPKRYKTEAFDFVPPKERMPMYVLRFVDKFLGNGSSPTIYSYLWNYGYIPKVLNLSKTGAENYNGDIPPCALINAIKEFQLFNQILPNDGKLTREITNRMAWYRCGNIDVKCETAKCLAEDRFNSKVASFRRRRYAVREKKWKGSTKRGFYVAYYYENEYDANARDKIGHDSSFTGGAVKREIEKGLFEWSKYAGLTFIEIDDKLRAHVHIRFGSHAHGERNPKAYFDGSYGVLAHTYYPRNGEMHFDQSENYTASKSRGINMHYVAAHEMGHGLGIEHSSYPYALMAPYYFGYREEMLSDDDIRAVRRLYGLGHGMVIPLERDPYITTGKHLAGKTISTHVHTKHLKLV